MKTALKELPLFFQYLAKHKYSYLLGVFFLFSTNWLAVNIPLYIGSSIDILNNQLTGNYEELVNNIYIVI